ncbi:MAG: hypothetical protein PVH24_04105 [Candidatus Zixiibacteriota bacterium]|jgi:hypothetical protein
MATEPQQTVAISCADCVHADSCLYWTVRTPLDTECCLAERMPPVSDTVDEVVPDDSNKRPLKGLCVNCENRFDCQLPKADGGVWHCEEYR